MSVRSPAKVYFIADESKAFVKIGVSTKPESRLFDLQAGSPLILNLILVLEFEGPGAAELEDALHQHFAAHWIHREWFAYAKPIRSYVEEWLDGGSPSVPKPPHSSAQAIGEYGERLTKIEFLSKLKSRAPQ